ncbi:aldehyde dehydrogenase family protein [uncultured Cocleimonas sp.]|uniref:acylating sulfoacetaldehyde dehydrogenase n=1 Tax=uncultured Cocleimonas sp. TaxID=1051587 RepID=UPI0026121A01|nr:aldehyde dehydrogenase family protein [uncultured Cocleimonas sp.]
MSSSTNTVSELVNRARKAQLIYEQYTQEQVDEVVTALGWSIIKSENNQALATMSVADTGLGNVEDKIIKNHRKTLGLLRDLKGVKTVGVVSENIEKGIIKIARPVGVVGAVVPSTNPAATPVNKTINALKCRNAIILAPSPKGASSCAKLVEFMHAELERIGAPKDLVQHLPFPINKADTQQLMKEVDLVVATGSQNNMRDAYASGTPAFGVGAGNVVSIVDETADLDSAAQKIVASKSFDNATSCSSENQLVIVDAVYDQMIEALAKQHAIMLNDNERDQVCEKLWQNGYLNQAIIAKKANEIAQICELDAPNQDNAKVLCVAATGIGEGNPLSGEKLSPVLTVYRASDYEDAKNITNQILDYQGKGHSISIHSSNDDRILDLGLTMPACRIIVNQAHCFATGGSFDNGMPFSLSMGCGTWGNNNMSDNMNYKYYLNTTRIVRTIPVNQPTLESLFGDYWQAHHISAVAEF